MIGALWRWEAPLRRLVDRKATTVVPEASPRPSAQQHSAQQHSALQPSVQRRSALRRSPVRRLTDRLTSLLRTDPVGVLVWHQAAALLPALVFAVIVPGVAVPGLTAAPTGPAWLLARLCWLPVFAVVLAVVGTRHRPTDTGRGERAGSGVAADQGVTFVGADQRVDRWSPERRRSA